MKNATRHTLLFAGLVGLWASAFAAGHDPAKGDKFGRMDSNGDGQVTAAEHATGADKQFKQLDGDMDGFVSAAEMDAAHAAHPGAKPGKSSAEKIKTIDTDGDGRLSSAEHATGSQKMFAAADADKNGSVDAAEMKAAHEAYLSQR